MIGIIEWPQPGAAQPHRLGGFYIVEKNEGGYTPLSMPFKDRWGDRSARRHTGLQDAYDFLVWGLL